MFNPDTMKRKPFNLLITDKGDPSVGIYPCTWAVECPFNKNADSTVKEQFRSDMELIYREYCDGGIELFYEDEEYIPLND